MPDGMRRLDRKRVAQRHRFLMGNQWLMDFNPGHYSFGAFVAD